MKRYILHIFALLCTIACTLSTYCLTPGKRGSVIKLMEALEAGLDAQEARERAIALKLSAAEQKDNMVQRLVLVADSKGIHDILDATRSVSNAETVVSPAEIVPNPAVQQIYDDFTLFSKSLENFKPSKAYLANTRKIDLFAQEAKRIKHAARELSETELNAKDKATINDLLENSLPALTKKIKQLEKDASEQEVARRTEPAVSIPATTQPAPTKPTRDIQKVPAPMRELIQAYVNKEYTPEQILTFIKNNEPGYDMEPHTFTAKEALVKNIEKDPRSSWLIQKLYWDPTSVVNAYYQLQWLKLQCKKFGYTRGLQATTNALTYLLSESSNDVSVVVDLFRDKTPIKNKYFIEFVDEFERNNADERLNRFERRNPRKTKS